MSVTGADDDGLLTFLVSVLLVTVLRFTRQPLLYPTCIKLETSQSDTDIHLAVRHAMNSKHLCYRTFCQKRQASKYEFQI